MRTVHLLLVALLAAAQATPQKKDLTALKGLDAMEVVVEELDPVGRAISLTRDEIQTEVELRARALGIRVKDGAAAFLAVNVGLLGVEAPCDGIVTYSMSIALYDRVILVRDTALTNRMAAVWVDGYHGYSGSSRARAGVLDGIDSLMKKFLNDYLTANPRVTTPPATLPRDFHGFDRPAPAPR